MTTSGGLPNLTPTPAPTAGNPQLRTTPTLFYKDALDQRVLIATFRRGDWSEDTFDVNLFYRNLRTVLRRHVNAQIVMRYYGTPQQADDDRYELRALWPRAESSDELEGVINADFFHTLGTAVRKVKATT